MAESEFLKRIDAHVARTNELIERDRVAWRQAMAAHGDDLKDIRFEQRQFTLRSERIAQGYLRVLEDMSGRLEDMSGRLEDMSDQLRANTRAVLSMLDKLERGGGPAPSGG
jgi:hypothetical protein